MDAAELSHDDLRVLVTAHALEALEPDEAAAVRAHLATCAECRAAFDEALETAALLAQSVPGSEPPPALRERILASARATPRPEAARATGLWRRFASTFTPSRNFAVAFALAAGLLGVLWIAERDRADELAARGDAAALVAAALSSPGARVVSLAPAADSGAGGAVVLAADRSVLVADLLEAPPGSQWEVWAIGADGAPVSIGVLGGGTDAVAQLDRALAPGTTVAVTNEPDDGRHQGPTGQIVLSGALA